MNGQGALQTEFMNQTPVLESNLVFEGAIYPAEDPEQVIYQREVERFSVAPYSVFNFPIVFEDGNLIAGEYIFKGSASKPEDSWEFEESFVIE